jgi:hypothetical protein
MPSVPWADISANPDTYYNTTTFNVPCRLVAPELLTLPDLYILPPFFVQSSSSANPFRFRPKLEIQNRISGTEKQAGDDNNAGDDEPDGAPGVVPSWGKGVGVVFSTGESISRSSCEGQDATGAVGRDTGGATQDALGATSSAIADISQSDRAEGVVGGTDAEAQDIAGVIPAEGGSINERSREEQDAVEVGGAQVEGTGGSRDKCEGNVVDVEGAGALTKPEAEGQ